MQPRTVYRFADLILDTGLRRLERAGVPIELGRLTYQLLLALVEAAPNVLGHDDLVERVWAGRPASPETITQRVKLLRDALGDDAEQPRYVAVVRGQGYALIPPVERQPHQRPGVAAAPAAEPAAEQAQQLHRNAWARRTVAVVLVTAAALGVYFREPPRYPTLASPPTSMHRCPTRLPFCPSRT